MPFSVIVTVPLLEAVSILKVTGLSPRPESLVARLAVTVVFWLVLKLSATAEGIWFAGAVGVTGGVTGSVLEPPPSPLPPPQALSVVVINSIAKARRKDFALTTDLSLLFDLLDTSCDPLSYKATILIYWLE